jgi:hypothetical protein
VRSTGSKYAFIAQINELKEVALKANATTEEELIHMRRNVRSMQKSHFSRYATMRHIVGLLNGGFGASDLRCGNFTIFSRDWEFP